MQRGMPAAPLPGDGAGRRASSAIPGLPAWRKTGDAGKLRTAPRGHRDMPHLELTPKTDISSFRKLAIGSWQTTYDPTVYGTLQVRMDKALAYIEAFRQRTGQRLTVTHLMTKAMGEALRRCPEANAILRFNKIYLRKQVTISALVVQTDGGKVDLTSAKIDHADVKSLR